MRLTVGGRGLEPGSHRAILGYTEVKLHHLQRSAVPPSPFSSLSIHCPGKPGFHPEHSHPTTTVLQGYPTGISESWHTGKSCY